MSKERVMKRVVAVMFVLMSLVSSGIARRGNPSTYVSSTIQYYLIDSDDNHAQKPTYQFLDTTFGAWTRVTGLSNPDSGYIRVFPVGTTFTMKYFSRQITLPPRYIHVNGFVTHDSVAPMTANDTVFRSLSSSENEALPFSPFTAHFPLWSNLELRSDTSKVYYRTVSDTCYVSFYNMALKGTHGKIRATFQIVFARLDSSITFQYRSFDGNVDGDSAERIFERTATIGLQDSITGYATTYLDRGSFYARSFIGSQYEKPLHDGLAVKFLQDPRNIVRLVSIDNPTSTTAELPGSSLTPTLSVENMTDTTRKIYVSYVVKNATTGAQVFSRNDSILNVSSGMRTHTGPTMLNVPCGHFTLTVTISTATNNTDVWTQDNVLVRDFVRLTPLTFTFVDDYKILDRCNYHVYGVRQVASGGDVFYDQAAPVTSGAVILDRRDAANGYYLSTFAGDTLMTAPIDLAGRSNPHLIFTMQRGSKSDSIKAGIRSRLLVGPERKVVDSANVVIGGDSLIIEAIASSASTYNPTEVSWKRIAAYYGGIDLASEKVRIQIPSLYVHNHSRFRFRLHAKKDGAAFGTPFDDADEFLIDGVQINAPTFGNKNETDIEVTRIELGNGDFTNIPRNSHSLDPIVTAASNGLQVTQGVYQVRLVIRDQLNREVYHQMKSLPAPLARSDAKLKMPTWIVEGSQGGVFTCKATIEQTFSDYHRANDTNVLYRKILISDVYAFDDGTPDTAGTMTAAETNFTFEFVPLSTDSLRGIEFFHLTANDTTNWTIFIRDSASNIISQKDISYNVLARGFQRSVFSSPVKLDVGKKYSVQCSLTQGFGIGGDASRGHVLLSKSKSTLASSEFAPLYDSLLRRFSSASGTKYFDTNRTVLNASGGGPLLPMVRLVFTGSATYLPVELLSFRAERLTDGDVGLHFETAKEDNAAQFIIERLRNDHWQLVVHIPAENISNGSRYQTLDVNAPPSHTLYRLSEQDLDGSITQLGTAEVSAFPEMDVTITIYPSPASDILHIQSPVTIREVTLRDVAGKVIHSNDRLLVKEYDININGIPSGVYLVILVDENGIVYREKVLIR